MIIKLTPEQQEQLAPLYGLVTEALAETAASGEDRRGALMAQVHPEHGDMRVVFVPIKARLDIAGVMTAHKDEIEWCDDDG